MACKKQWGDGGGGHWLVWMEWRPAGGRCLPLLIFPCTIKSRDFLLALAHPGGPGKRAVKWWLFIITYLHLNGHFPGKPGLAGPISVFFVPQENTADKLQCQDVQVPTPTNPTDTSPTHVVTSSCIITVVAD